MATTKYGRGESEFVTEGAGIVPAQKGPRNGSVRRTEAKEEEHARYTVAG